MSHKDINLPSSPSPSMAPAWCGGKRTQSSPLPNTAARLSARKAAVAWPHRSSQTLSVFCFGFFLSAAFFHENTLHVLILLVCTTEPLNLSLCLRFNPSTPFPALAKQSLAAHPLVRRGLSQKAVMDDSSRSSLVWQEGACCSTKDLAARCLICSRDDVQSAGKGPHLKHDPLLFKRYRRLANGHPGPFLMGVWFFCLMGTQSKLKGRGKDIPGGPFKLRSKTDNQVTNFKQVYCKGTLQRGDKECWVKSENGTPYLTLPTLILPITHSDPVHIHRSIPRISQLRSHSE